MFRLPTNAAYYSGQITNQNKVGVYKCSEKRCKICNLYLYSYVWTRF